MISTNTNIINSTERIEYLELHVQILKDHMNKHGKKTDPEALEFLEEKVAVFERELKIRKDFPDIVL